MESLRIGRAGKELVVAGKELAEKELAGKEQPVAHRNTMVKCHND